MFSGLSVGSVSPRLIAADYQLYFRRRLVRACILSEHEYIDVEARVRCNTTPASLTAGMLIFFGFMVHGGPTGDGMFLAGDTLFHYALRVGGLAMVAVAVMSAIGTPYALFTDAIVSGLVGMSLCVSAALLSTATEVSFNYIIYFIVGFTMVMSGLRNWRDYGKLPRVFRDDGLSNEVLDAFGQPFGAESDVRGALNGGGREGAESQEAAPIILQPKKKSFAKRSSSTRPGDDVINLDDLPVTGKDAVKRESPPPQGYLADLSRKGRPPTRPTP